MPPENELELEEVGQKPALLDEDLKSCLLAILQNIEAEDQFVRLNQLREFKRNNLFWHGFQYVYWSETEMDWRIPTQDKLQEIEAREEVDYIYDYVVNIFKAHGESIIAALSAELPTVRFGPRNADDPNDVRAVRAAENIVKLVSRQNKAQLLLIHALFLMSTEGFIASYTYTEEDGRKYGTAKVKKYGKQLAPVGPAMSLCMQCGYEQENVQDSNICPNCGSSMEPQDPPMEEVPTVVGTVDVDKSGEIVEVYGPLNVRVPSYAFDQKSCHYLILYDDGHPAVYKEKYPEFSGTIDGSTGMEYERLMRSTSLSQGYNYTTNLTTRRRVWLRPSAFNMLGDSYEDERKRLRALFPDGVKFTVFGDEVVEAGEENLDDHWTITKAGPSKGVHADPTLKSLVSPQELRNEMLNLLVMTTEHSVPVTYADTEVYDFEGASRQETSPGFVYPAKPRPGKSISDGFYQTGGATLSRESSVLLNTMDHDAQFAVGSFPSVYGGPSSSGSKTLGEYEKSRGFALQRLSLMWYYLNLWYGETMHKAVKSFVANQIEDETFSVPNGNTFKAIRINKDDLATGRFDFIEPESSSSFPISFAQKRSILMELAMLNNEDINAVLFNPENAGLVKSLVGLSDMKVPDEIQREKQYYEILQLVQGAPGVGADGQTPRSSVDVDIDLDDHPVHMSVLRNFLVGESGLALRDENPAGYDNCVAHYMQHKLQVMLAAMPPAPGPMQPNIPPPEGEESNASD